MKLGGGDAGQEAYLRIDPITTKRVLRQWVRMFTRKFTPVT